MAKPKLLHVAKDKRRPGIWSKVFLDVLGELCDFEIVENGGDMPKDDLLKLLRSANILLIAWQAIRLPDEIAEDPGNIKYFCALSGSVTQYVGENHILSGIPLTNWSVETPTTGLPIAEGAMMLLLAVLRDLHHHIQLVRNNGHKPDYSKCGGRLYDLPVGIYGYGIIGKKFINLLRPFGPIIRIYDPYMTEVPDGCMRVETLDELFETSKAMVIHAGLTDETRNTVNAERLAMLPDHGIIINTARGGIIDQEALFAELKSGRLRAGLDVLEPDHLPPDHDARTWENLIWTGHSTGSTSWPTDGEEPERLTDYQEICIDNISRFLKGEPLKGIMDIDRYRRST